MTDRLLRKEQPAGDLRVGQPLGEQAQHIHLSRGQLQRICLARRPRAARYRQPLQVPFAQ